MKMEVFEYGIYARKEEVAGANDLEFAEQIAHLTANTMHCDVDIINSFTGEVHLSLVCLKHIVWHADKEIVETYYEVKERGWD